MPAHAQGSTKENGADEAYKQAQYFRGMTGEKLDLAQALVHLRKAAELGHGAAQVELGFLLFNGSAQVAKDLPLSLRWFRQAASRNVVAAQCMLGDFHAQGLGGAKLDAVEAVRWYSLAATSNDKCAPKAQYGLYAAHESGQGARKDLKLATAWLVKAANAGNPQAQATLGRAYAAGKGVPRDAELALEWRRKSREGVSWHEDHEPHYLAAGRKPAHDHKH